MFSDAVFAVIITILVLGLKPPNAATFSALLALWPAGYITYLAICWEAVDRPAHEDLPQRTRRMLGMRSFITIGVFAAAAVIALRWPVVAMALICLCLIGYLRPDTPGPKDVGH
jgi:uncharacterized membrane protein